MPRVSEARRLIPLCSESLGDENESHDSNGASSQSSFDSSGNEQNEWHGSDAMTTTTDEHSGDDDCKDEFDLLKRLTKTKEEMNHLRQQFDPRSMHKQSMRHAQKLEYWYDMILQMMGNYRA